MTSEMPDHPALASVKAAFGDRRLIATEFRGQVALILDSEDAHEILRFLRDDPGCDFKHLVDVTAVDYLDYPAATPGRFAVVWVLRSLTHNTLLVVKSHLDPSIDTMGIEADPALEMDSVCDLWEGAEWREREVFDMFGIRFRNHPDLRRILLWRDFPAHPLRKDYPLRGRGERENYAVVDREDA